LVSPRIIAGLISMPLLTAIFNVVFHDVFGGLLNSVSFGVIITWICCYKGFEAPRMPPE
jgi:phospholipid/cholesterol/gamma-HCH transport system permease protein